MGFRPFIRKPKSSPILIGIPQSDAKRRLRAAASVWGRSQPWAGRASLPASQPWFERTIFAMLDIAPHTLVPAEALPKDTPNLPVPGDKASARALLVGDRIDTTALERDETLPTISTL